MLVFVKPCIFALSSVPFLYFSWQIYALMNGMPHNLGVDPGVELMHQMAHWALNFLMITLSLTPLRYITGWIGFVKLRRMLGLFTFFYACLHVLAYLIFILGLDWAILGEDIVKRPYMIVGAMAFVLLFLLSLTSNRWSIRKLGKKWKRLHQAVYLVVPLVVVHFLWSTRASWEEPGIYGAIGLILLLYRFSRWILKQRSPRSNSSSQVST